MRRSRCLQPGRKLRRWRRDRRLIDLAQTASSLGRRAGSDSHFARRSAPVLRRSNAGLLRSSLRPGNASVDAMRSAPPFVIKSVISDVALVLRTAISTDLPARPDPTVGWKSASRSRSASYVHVIAERRPTVPPSNSELPPRPASLSPVSDARLGAGMRASLPISRVAGLRDGARPPSSTPSSMVAGNPKPARQCSQHDCARIRRHPALRDPQAMRGAGVARDRLRLAPADPQPPDGRDRVELMQKLNRP